MKYDKIKVVDYINTDSKITPLRNDIFVLVITENGNENRFTPLTCR